MGIEVHCNAEAGKMVNQTSTLSNRPSLASCEVVKSRYLRCHEQAHHGGHDQLTVSIAIFNPDPGPAATTQQWKTRGRIGVWPAAHTNEDPWLSAPTVSVALRYRS